MPSSVIKEKKDDEAIVVDDSSDVEILEEMNGSAVTAGKRKVDGDKDGAEKKKKQKTIVSVSSTPSKVVASAPKDTGTAKNPAASKEKKVNVPSTLVDLKGSKFVLKQKALALNEVPSTTKARLSFQEFFKELPSDHKLDAWPKPQHNFIACLIHESDKTTPNLAKAVRATLLSSVEFLEADSQDTEASKLTSEERIPLAPLTELINSLATRNNYGLEVSDLPSGLPEGVSDLPLGLQIWRWEVNDSDILPPELETKLERRKAERTEAKSRCVELFLALSSSEQTALFSKAPATKKASAPKSTPNQPTASGSAGTVKKEKVVKEEKVKVEVSAEELEAKAKAKAVKEAEQAARKVAREKAAAEREEKKAAAEQKKAEKAKLDAEKKEKAEKAALLLKKQAGMLTGFFTKKSASPAPGNVVQAKPGQPVGTEFARVFLPFHVKPNVSVTPINQFRKAQTGKGVEVEINSQPGLTLQDSLKSFVQDVPRRSILPFNPRPTPPISVRDTMQAINDANLTGADPNVYYRLLNDRTKVPIKFLKFKEDVRPGYVGTWTKASSVIRPRAPLAQDKTLLKYDYESEDEWSEEEDGGDAEELNSDGDLSAEEESDALSDDWMADDDEAIEFVDGYQEGDDAPMDVDDDDDIIIMETVESLERKRVAEKERKAKLARERKKTVGLLLPLVKGPFWEPSLGKPIYDPFVSMRIQFINDACVGLDPFKFESSAIALPPAKKGLPSSSAVGPTPIASTSSIPSASLDVKPTPKSAKISKAIPESLMPRVIRLFHQSSKTRPILIQETYDELEGLKTLEKVTKTSIDATLKEVATKLKGVWVVKDEFLRKYSDKMEVDA